MTRNKKIAVLSIVSAAVLIIIFIWNPSVKSNRTMEYRNDRNMESEIQFSKNSGFYAEDFALEIYAPTNDIYYTLDGSEPDRQSTKYIQPLNISDATLNKNVYSARTDTTTGFLVDMIEEYCNGVVPGYQVPDYNVDKCTVVRAVYYSEAGEKSDVITGIYFIGYDNKPGYDGVNIICITTDPDNLFDYEKGIYVTGIYFDRFVEEGKFDAEVNPMSPYWWWWEGNYRQKGKAFERSATIHLIDTGGGYVHRGCRNTDSGWRKQGVYIQKYQYLCQNGIWWQYKDTL